MIIKKNVSNPLYLLKVANSSTYGVTSENIGLLCNGFTIKIKLFHYPWLEKGIKLKGFDLSHK